jgi:probable phosphoglycerate mutase
MTISIYCDGAASRKLRSAGIGVYVKDRLLCYPKSKNIGEATSNVAELSAVIEGLKLAMYLPRSEPITIFTDSQYVFGVLCKGWIATKNKELVAEARKLLYNAHVGIMWIPREENEQADELAKQAVINGSSEIKAATEG